MKKKYKAVKDVYGRPKMIPVKNDGINYLIAIALAILFVYAVNWIY